MNEQEETLAGEIQLGDKVECQVTGMVGTVIADIHSLEGQHSFDVMESAAYLGGKASLARLDVCFLKRLEDDPLGLRARLEESS
ncbi:MAG: hypothetical protein KAJ19_25450 [Gammaproteobacteria bacterium]|nr:hypothetical protein [Gammaproteobacteria bacterium]